MPRWPNQDLLDRTTVQSYIFTMWKQPLDDHVAMKVKGMKLESSNPSIWSVDALMVSSGHHLNELFEWARSRHFRIWAHGEPAWHRQPPDWNEIDKTWPDPEAAE
jgi:hypothetical protein